MENHELIDEKAKGSPNWMTTFADLMSLLMCFFVLLLSYSVMDAEKFKQIAGSMKMAFGVQSDTVFAAIPKGTSVIKTEFSPGKPQPTPFKTIQQHTSEVEQPHLNQSDQKSAQAVASNLALKQTLEQLLKHELDNELIEFEMLGQQLIIHLNERGSFSSGSSYLQPQFKPVLSKLAIKLADVPGIISVAGHTDDLPVNNELHRNNWELASKRANAVLQTLLSTQLFKSPRLHLEAFADTKPRFDNTTAQNRAKNRRVEITISQGNQLSYETTHFE